MSKLPSDYYLNESVVDIASDLLGKILMTRFDGKLTSGRIIETEAYNGREDKACHAYGNLYTARTKVMYQTGGRAYVYLCYGIHHLFNVVTNVEGKADAVLIRAIEPVEGLEHMLSRRNMKMLKASITSGPGKLSQALGIHTKHSNESLGSNRIWIEDHHDAIAENRIGVSKRIGVDYAEEAKDFLWRFTLKGNPYLSR